MKHRAAFAERGSPVFHIYEDCKLAPPPAAHVTAKMKGQTMCPECERVQKDELEASEKANPSYRPKKLPPEPH